MESKELKAAGNALVEWFNSQEISQADALLVMSKVIAKIIAKNVHKRAVLERGIDTFTLTLVHDVNAHTYDRKWRPEL